MACSVSRPTDLLQALLSSSARYRRRSGMAGRAGGDFGISTLAPQLGHFAFKPKCSSFALRIFPHWQATSIDISRPSFRALKVCAITTAMTATANRQRRQSRRPKRWGLARLSPTAIDESIFQRRISLGTLDASGRLNGLQTSEPSESGITFPYACSAGFGPFIGDKHAGRRAYRSATDSC